MTTPFDPPMDVVGVEEARASAVRWGLVLGTWGLSFSAIGTAVGGALQLAGWAEGSAASIGVGSGAAGALLGAVVLLMERAQAIHRPELLGPHGVSRPLHGAVLGIPLLVVALPGLLSLAVVGMLALGSLVPVLVFGMAALGALWAGVRVLSQHRLARALEEVQLGDDGARPLESVAGTWWLARQVREAARINLALLALREGDHEGAMPWLRGRWSGGAGAWASVGLALAHLLRGDPPAEAERHLRDALTSPRASDVQAEADAVRVLVVWRDDGPSVALALAEQLHGGPATALLRALLGTLRARHADPDGAATLLRDEAVVSLLRSGLGRVIPELAAAHELVMESVRGGRVVVVDDQEVVLGPYPQERWGTPVHEHLDRRAAHLKPPT